MTRPSRWRAACAVLALAAIAAIAAPAGAQDDSIAITNVDFEDFPDIVLEFSAPPSLAGTELTPETITLLEGGEPRDITVTAEAAVNIEVVVAIDTSGSMFGAPIDQAKVAAQQFIEQLPSGSRVAVVGFGQEAEVLLEFSTDLGAASSTVGSIEVDPNAETSLYDAVRLSVQQFSTEVVGPRYILVVTDGKDTISEADLGTAQAAVLAAEIPVYAVSLVTTESDPAALAALTGETGGGVAEATDPEGLADITNQIASAISAQYVVRYESQASGRTVVQVTAETGDSSATGQIAVDFPLVIAPDPSPTPTVTPEATATPVPLVNTPARRVVVEDSGPGWLLPVGIVFLAIAMGVLFYYLLTPARKRKNLLKEMSPVASRAAKESGSVLGMAAASLQRGAEKFILARDEEGTLGRMLDRAGIRMRPAEFLVTVSLAAVALGLVGLIIHPIVALLLVVLVVAVAFLFLAIVGSKRAEAFGEQLPSTLQMMSGGLKAGFSLSQVVDLVANEASEPARDEFSRMSVEESLGRDISESFRDVANRMDSEDFMWVAEAVDINRAVGGDLSEVLENVSKTIRSRHHVARDIKTMSAEGRISAIILICVPFVVLFAQLIIAPDLMAVFTGTTEGRVVSAIGLVMITIGALWMRQIVKLKY